MKRNALDCLGRVLVVDDERTLANSLVLILRARGYCAVAAFDAEEALHTAGHFQPDCLLADVYMPGMNGVELATAMQEFAPRCKVLLLSGDPHPAPLENARSRGYDFQLLPKPLPPDELLRILGDVLETSERPVCTLMAA